MKLSVVILLVALAAAAAARTLLVMPSVLGMAEVDVETGEYRFRIPDSFVDSDAYQSTWKTSGPFGGSSTWSLESSEGMNTMSFFCVMWLPELKKFLVTGYDQLTIFFVDPVTGAWHAWFEPIYGPLERGLTSYSLSNDLYSSTYSDLIEMVKYGGSIPFARFPFESHEMFTYDAVNHRVYFYIDSSDYLIWKVDLTTEDLKTSIFAGNDTLDGNGRQVVVPVVGMAGKDLTLSYNSKIRIHALPNGELLVVQVFNANTRTDPGVATRYDNCRVFTMSADSVVTSVLGDSSKMGITDGSFTTALFLGPMSFANSADGMYTYFMDGGYDSSWYTFKLLRRINWVDKVIETLAGNTDLGSLDGSETTTFSSNEDATRAYMWENPEKFGPVFSASPAGLSVSADGRTLYIAENCHYGSVVRKFDVETKKLSMLLGNGSVYFAACGATPYSSTPVSDWDADYTSPNTVLTPSPPPPSPTAAEGVAPRTLEGAAGRAELWSGWAGLTMTLVTEACGEYAGAFEPAVGGCGTDGLTGTLYGVGFRDGEATVISGPTTSLSGVDIPPNSQLEVGAMGSLTAPSLSVNQGGFLKIDVTEPGVVLIVNGDLVLEGTIIFVLSPETAPGNSIQFGTYTGTATVNPETVSVQVAHGIKSRNLLGYNAVVSGEISCNGGACTLTAIGMSSAASRNNGLIAAVVVLSAAVIAAAMFLGYTFIKSQSTETAAAADADDSAPTMTSGAASGAASGSASNA